MPLSKREKDSLLDIYGGVESESEDEATDNPMTPEQIQSLLDRQIALTRELDEEVPAPPSKERT